MPNQRTIDALEKMAAIEEITKERAQTLLNVHFQLAVLQGDCKTAKEKITMGADVNAPLNNGITPLMASLYAPMAQQTMIFLLLANKADVLTQNHEGKTVIDMAIHRGQKICVELFATHINAMEIKNQNHQKELLKADCFIQATTQDTTPQRNESKPLLLALLAQLKRYPADGQAIFLALRNRISTYLEDLNTEVVAPSAKASASTLKTAIKTTSEIAGGFWENILNYCQDLNQELTRSVPSREIKPQSTAICTHQEHSAKDQAPQASAKHQVKS